MRLAKYLAHAGVASRRASELIIADGRVTVDGRRITDPARDVDDSNAVKVDGQRVKTTQRARRLPGPQARGRTSRPRKDPQGRPTVVALVPSRERLYPVGRLDYDTTGLILLTNDGDLAHRLTHPSFEVPRTYRARIANAAGQRAGDARSCARASSSRTALTAPAKVRRVGSNHLELTIHEGRKRQVKRMFEAVGHPVRCARARRRSARCGSAALQEGEHRELNPAEIERLRSLG